MGVAVGCLDFEDTILNGQERNIESSSSEIEDENVAFALTLLVETVSNGGCGWLVDDALNVEAGDGTSVFGSLTLGVVEVSGNSDDGVFNWFAQVCFGDFLHLEEHHG